jgi:hypothetical protein
MTRTSAEIGASIRAHRRGTPEHAERMALADESDASGALRSLMRRRAPRAQTLAALARVRALIDRLELDARTR